MILSVRGGTVLSARKNKILSVLLLVISVEEEEEEGTVSSVGRLGNLMWREGGVTPAHRGRIE